MIDELTLARAKAIATSAWSDAIDAAGVGQVMDGLLWRTGSGRTAGRALTVLEEVGDLGTYPELDLRLGAVFEQGSVGDAIVISVGGHEVSTFGGLAGRAAAAHGFTAVVIDGACRDLDELRLSPVAVVSRHLTPRSGKGRVRVSQINVSITCGGATVHPGDLVVADETGVVVVPKDAALRVLSQAEEIAGKDRQFEAALETGQSFEAVANNLQHM